MQQNRRDNGSHAATPRSFHYNVNPGENVAPPSAIHIGTESSYESFDSEQYDFEQDHEDLQHMQIQILQAEGTRRKQLEYEHAKRITMDQAQQILRSIYPMQCEKCKIFTLHRNR